MGILKYDQHYDWYNGNYNGIMRVAENEAGYHLHDKGYKSLLSSKKVFLEMLRSFVNQSWVNNVNENDLIRIDKSYVSQDFSGQESDIVYQAKLRRGLKTRDIYFYVLVELQSKVDALMPFRLLSYMVEIWRDTIKDAGKLSARMKFQLPVIVPIVIYNGKRRWNVPLSFKGKLTSAKLFGDEVLDFSYLLIDIWRYDEQELFRKGNLISSVFLLDRTEEAPEVVKRITEMIHIIKQLPKSEREQFWGWVTRILSRKLPQSQNEEIATIVKQSTEDEVDMMITNIEKAIMRTRKQDREEGKLEAKRQIAKKLFEMGMEVNQVAAVTGMTIDEIQAAGY
jgi:predicted transposase/invertase (TIGR01784 family)